MKVKLSGLMKPWRVAKNEPAKPPNMAPSANAVSLVLVGLMPSARQAISSSRSASQARPIGSLRMRSTKALVISARIRIRKYRNDDPVEAGIFEAEELVEGRLALVGRAVERHAEEGRARDVGDAVRAAGHRVPVEQDDPDDLAEAEGHDRQVVAAQAQHREAEQDAERGRERAGERQALPEAEIEPAGEQRVGVGADRVEGDVAEVQQPGEADHDVQAPAEHDVDQHRGRDVDHVAVGERQERQHEGEHQAGREQELGIGIEQRRDPRDRRGGGRDGLGLARCAGRPEAGGRRRPGRPRSAPSRNGSCRPIPPST